MEAESVVVVGHDAACPRLPVADGKPVTDGARAASLAGVAVQVQLHEHQKSVEVLLVGHQVRPAIQPVADRLLPTLQTAGRYGVDAPVFLVGSRAPAFVISGSTMFSCFHGGDCRFEPSWGYYYCLLGLSATGAGRLLAS